MVGAHRIMQSQKKPEFPFMSSAKADEMIPRGEQSDRDSEWGGLTGRGPGNLPSM